MYDCIRFHEPFFWGIIADIFTLCISEKYTQLVIPEPFPPGLLSQSSCLRVVHFVKRQFSTGKTYRHLGYGPRIRKEASTRRSDYWGKWCAHITDKYRVVVRSGRAQVFWRVQSPTRICAKIIWHLSYKTYHLRVSSLRHPSCIKSMILKAEWDNVHWKAITAKWRTLVGWRNKWDKPVTFLRVSFRWPMQDCIG